MNPRIPRPARSDEVDSSAYPAGTFLEGSQDGIFEDGRGQRQAGYLGSLLSEESKPHTPLDDLLRGEEYPSYASRLLAVSGDSGTRGQAPLNGARGPGHQPRMVDPST
jgi:hypothetical protein